jgi:hypothetical protein
MSKARRVAIGVAAASAVVGGLLMNVGHGDRRDLGVEAAEPNAPAPAVRPMEAPVQDGRVRADASGIQVDVDKDRGKVSVTAPHADVRVDPDAGRVQVRAPYVNLDIRW